MRRHLHVEEEERSRELVRGGAWRAGALDLSRTSFLAPVDSCAEKAGAWEEERNAAESSIAPLS